MQKETRKTPSVRFKGFTDDWEQRKLIELGKIVTGSTPSTTHSEYYSDDGIPWVTPTDITGNLIYDTQKKLSAEGQKNSRIVPAGTILVTCIASIGKNAMLATQGSFNQQINGLIPNKEKCAPYFLLTESCIWSKKMKAQAAAGTMQIVNKNEFSSIETRLPSLEEQRQIGSLFSSLDNLITLHQRKCEQMKQAKKYFLQNMFPRKGETIPRIRFKGFNDAWEQRKLGDLIIKVNRTDENSTAPVMMITAENGFIRQSERYAYNNSGKSLKKYIVLKHGELAYNHGASKLRPYGSCFALTTEQEARIPFVYHCFATNYANAEFLALVLNGKSVENELRKIISSGARMDGLLNISFADYESIPLRVPAKDEQDKIAAYFRNLDNRIALHQQKYEQLQQLKKFFLQNLFI